MDPMIQLRFSLVTTLKDKTVEELQIVYDWVVGPKQTILPVSSFKEVK